MRRVNACHGCAHPSGYTHDSSNNAEFIVLTWPKDGRPSLQIPSALSSIGETFAALLTPFLQVQNHIIK